MPPGKSNAEQTASGPISIKRKEPDESGSLVFKSQDAGNRPRSAFATHRTQSEQSHSHEREGGGFRHRGEHPNAAESCVGTGGG